MPYGLLDQQHRLLGGSQHALGDQPIGALRQARDGHERAPPVTRQPIQHGIDLGRHLVRSRKGTMPRHPDPQLTLTHRRIMPARDAAGARRPRLRSDRSLRRQHDVLGLRLRT